MNLLTNLDATGAATAAAETPVFEPVPRPAGPMSPPTLLPILPPIPTWIGTVLAAALSAVVVVCSTSPCSAAPRAALAPPLKSIDVSGPRFAHSIDPPARP